MTSTPANSDRLARWSRAFFLLSGATGLLYQVLWTRRLTLTFGHTVLAVSTVVTAFMAGLALGSLLAGFWADRQPAQSGRARYLAVYGYLEAFVGLWALLSLKLLSYSDWFYIELSSKGVNGLSLHLACFFAACTVLIPPTTAMGASLPVLAKVLVSRRSTVGGSLSYLYGLNTIGALVGAGLGGFVFLPVLGLKASMFIASTVNIAIGLGSVWLSGRERKEEAEQLQTSTGLVQQPGRKAKRGKPDSESSNDQQEAMEGPWWLIPGTFGMAGAASMIYQIGWNRSICLSIGSSVYAFTSILVMFLTGLALGSLLYSRIFQRRAPQLSHLGWLYFAIGCTGGVTVLSIALLPQLYLELAPWVGESFAKALLSNVGLTALALFLPTLLMGLGFPLATALGTPSMERLGRSVGQIYGANTAGCILGSFVAGFFLVPQLGAQESLKIATVLYFCAAMTVAVFADAKKASRLILACCLSGSLLVSLLPAWNSATMASGVSIYSSRYLGEESFEFSTPLAYEDGLSSAVSFHVGEEPWNYPNMKVNGKVDASFYEGDRLTQYLLGYLPCLLHAAPKRVGVIGLGGGFTLEAVAQVKGVQSILCAEIEPAVVRMGELWKPFNGRVLEDPRLKVVVQDGRTLILSSAETFDVIISEPSNPWIAGIGNLFTEDFYRLARAKLSPGGVMCQWFNLYHVSASDTKMVLRTFFEVFPEGSLWQSSGGDLLLIGTEKPTKFDADRVRSAWESSETIKRHFFIGGVYDPDFLPCHYLMNRKEALRRAGEGPLNTDDRPILEFSAPTSLYRQTFDDVLTVVWDQLELKLPPGVEPSEKSKRGFLFARLNREDFKGLAKQLNDYGPVFPEAFPLGAKAEMRHSDNNLEEARSFRVAGQARFPDDPLCAAIWAEMEFENGNFAEAAELYLIALARPPEGSEAHLCLRVGECLLAIGRPAQAIKPLLKSADLIPAASISLSLLGKALVTLEKDRESIEFLQVALKRNPSDPLAHQQISFAYFNLGDFPKAREHMETFVRMLPENDSGWLKLAMCLKKLGDHPGSRQAFEKSLQLNPAHASLAKDFE